MGNHLVDMSHHFAFDTFLQAVRLPWLRLPSWALKVVEVVDWVQLGWPLSDVANRPFYRHNPSRIRRC
ncbi:hypothetical protein LZT04_00415, partial [Vibrio fluvialis]|nr:hypothetical protein [Vibrio fluvialis]